MFRKERDIHGGKLSGLKVWVHVLGCRSNLYESEAIASELEARGAVLRDHAEGCDAAVIVSCSVTAVADKKCRQATRRARRAVGDDGLVAVCGCWAQRLSSEDARELGVDILVGNRMKHLLVDTLESMAATSERNFTDLRLDLGRENIWDALHLARPVLRSRAFLKVQEGCDHFCSYCIIPFLRGRPISRPPEQTLEEIRRLVDAGCREVVLTGTHLGTYGRDSESSLGDLVRRVSKVPGLLRLRLGSLEPFALDDDLLDALSSSPIFAPHLHLPLQSGDDGVLARMRRGYTADDFARLCERARKFLGDDLHISSDVLVAFPGEDERAFENTLELMEKTSMGRVHVFPYSSRRGTAAANFPDGGASRRVSPVVATERVHAAVAVGETLLHRYASRFVGRNLSVLYGYTPHFVSAAPAGSEHARTSCLPGDESGEPQQKPVSEEISMTLQVTECCGGELRGRPA